MSSTYANDSDRFSVKVWPEPLPEWTHAIEEWNWMWFAHIYGFASLFTLLTLYAFCSLFRFRRMAGAKQKVHLLFVSCAVITAGLGRALVLFWDPYTSKKSSSAIQNLAVFISWGIGTACITSAFSIILLIFLETTKITLGPPKLQNLPLLVSITLANIVYVSVSDVVVWFYSKAKVMIFICHITFVIWGLALSVGYFIAGFRMWQNLNSTLQARNFTDRDIGKLKRLFFFMSAASVFGLGNFSISLYVSVGELGVFASDRFAKSWPWFSMQTILRTMEIILCGLIFQIAADNRKNYQQESPRRSNFTCRGNSIEPATKLNSIA
ncbi:uncharacterized protein LOC111329651 [Stylophora pistillata]|uniref:uncharacterized protein LOC111329651 n=1 Tax=Stylophora pistillata TaxID=50429 RepID=UPI000C03CF85|nr:uncharacterized protein LOC111329651 [Stylophora pistillata]